MKKFSSFFVCKPRFGSQPFYVFSKSGKSIYKYYHSTRSWSRQTKFDIAYLLDMIVPFGKYTILVDNYSLSELQSLLLDECYFTNINPYSNIK